MGLDRGGAAVGHQELAALPAYAGDAFRKSATEQQAGRALAPRLRAGRPTNLRRSPRQSFRQPPRVLGAAGAVAAERRQPLAEIDARTPQAALAQQRGDFRRLRRLAVTRGVDQHARQPRRQREPRHRAALVGDAPLRVKRTEPDEQVARLGERRARRRIQERQPRRVVDAPQGEVEGEAGEVGGEDFRLRERREAAVGGLLPQPVTDARLDPAGAATTLVGVGARHAHGFEPRQAKVRLEAGRAQKPGIDDDAHALDGQRSLGDRGGEHDLAAPREGRGDGAILRARVERAVEGHDFDIGADAIAQRLSHPQNLALAGQEHEDRAAFLAERGERRPDDLVFDARPRGAAEIAGFHGKSAAMALDLRGALHQPRDSGAVERRRHHQQPQILAQRPLRVERERKPEVGVERALVEFVEQHGGDAGQFRVVDDHPREHALGDDFDARPRRDQALQAHAQADRIADALVQGRRHPLGGGAGGEPARLQHQDFTGFRELGVKQRQRDARGLAGAGRRHQHRARPRRQGLGQRPESVVDG